MPETQFKLQRVGDLALVTIDNGEDWTKPTVFGRAAMESLQRTLDEIEAQEWRALVLTGKPFVFAAGADLDQLPRMTTPELAVAGSRAGHEPLELGFADRLYEPAEFVDLSIAYAIEISETGVERAEPEWSNLADVIRRARSQLDDSIHGAAPAPYRALELIEGAAQWSVEEGYRKEEEAIAELLPGRQAQASIYAFDLV